MTTQRRIVRRPGNGRTSGAPRRLTAWDDEFHNFSLGNASFTQINLTTQVIDPEKRGYTLVRMIMDIYLFASPPGTVSGRQLMSLGVAVVSDDAFASGAAGLPDPDSEEDYPVGGWVWRTRLPVFDETLGAGIVQPVHIEKDLRAMRKLDRSTLALLVRNDVGEGTTFAVQIIGLTRTLYKLP